MQNAIEMKALLKPEAVSKLLSIGVSTVYHLSQRGILPAVKVGGALRFRAEAIEAYVKTLEKKAYGTAA